MSLVWRGSLAARGHDTAVTVAPGEVLAVVGPNGAGKSTLLELLCGLLRPDDGTLTVDGETLVGPGRFVPTHHRRIGLLGQQPLLFPHLDVLSNVAYGPRSQGARRGEARRVAAELLDRMGAAELAGRRPAELSGGQAARMALARALAMRPRALLLDEPFAAVDVNYTPKLREVLRDALAEIGCPAILVTHDPADVIALANTVAVFDAGRVVETGPISEVTSAPQSAFTRQLFA